MNSEILSNLHDVIFAAVVIAGPPLAISTAIGFLLAIFQAVTSIQDQTMPQTAKIVVIFLVLILMGGVLSQPLYAVTDRIFSNFAEPAG